MDVYLVTYRLFDRRAHIDPLTEYLTAFDHRKLTRSTYAIRTDRSAARIRDELSEVLGERDDYYVFKPLRAYAGYGPEERTDWLERYMPEQPAAQE